MESVSYKKESIVSKLNWLRAAVLGANDGIVSISGLVLGVAGATNSIEIIVTAGVAGIISGAISMAAGEYISVSSSRDTEKALILREKKALENDPEGELLELVEIYKSKGLKESTARIVAVELTKVDPVMAHLDAEHNIDPNHLTNPWHAAIASAISFFTGALIPLIAIILPPVEVRIPAAFISIVIALVLTGVISGRVSGASISHAIIRVIIGGVIAMVVTYMVGSIFHLHGV